MFWEKEGGLLPPIRRVRLPAGRSRLTSLRPVVLSGKVNVRLLTVIVGE